ncbi:MAG: fatty acid desaturase [Aestuariivita sp.]|uniref:fatty acid desaturase n=1 Tax=Aestuariivita sp. TaxID=1872407 RepID=UPI003BAF4641
MNLREYTRRYCDKDNRMAAASYFGTFAVYFASLYLAITFHDSWWIMIPAGVVHAVASVRLYVLQHDAGHLSLFETRSQNAWAGIGLSPFTFAPYEVMKQNHNLHHAGTGNLDHRETGEIHTMTLREWEAAGVWKRLQYRLYRNPFILVPLGALFTYFIRYRWPKNTMRFGVGAVLQHNALVAAWVATIYLLSGTVGLVVYFSFAFLGGMLGVFLVYLQHNFEDTYWERRPHLDPELAALQGASTLDFGHWFDIAVANITCHDLHHFNANIPSYRLRRARYDLPEEFAPRRIGFVEAIKALNLKLWDEDAQRLVPFPKHPANRAVRAQA